MNDALTGYAAKGGKIVKAKTIQGMKMFIHNTNFPCVLQPSDSVKETYYALHHMRAYVRDQQYLTLPSQLQDWALRLGRLEDDKIREEFYNIQQSFATIINTQVLHSSGAFHCRVELPNRDIDTILAAQGDERPFITPKGARLIFPGLSQKS